VLVVEKKEIMFVDFSLKFEDLEDNIL